MADVKSRPQLADRKRKKWYQNGYKVLTGQWRVVGAGKEVFLRYGGKAKSGEEDEDKKWINCSRCISKAECLKVEVEDLLLKQRCWQHDGRKKKK